jgi:hypothetical protein
MEQSCQGKTGVAGNEKPVKMIDELRLENEARSLFSIQIYLKGRKNRLTVKGLSGHNEQGSHPLIKHPVLPSFF